MVSSLSRYRWVPPWTLVIDWRRETCRDEHPVEWNASLYLSLSHDSGPAINSVVNRFHALLPFTEALSSRDYVLSLGFFAKTNLLLCPVIRRVYLCCLFRISLPPSLSCLFAYVSLVEVRQKGMRISETSIARRLVSWQLVVVPSSHVNVNIWYNIYYVHFYYFSSWRDRRK